jgi:hypothetical protein
MLPYFLPTHPISIPSASARSVPDLVRSRQFSGEDQSIASLIRDLLQLDDHATSEGVDGSEAALRYAEGRFER